MNKEILEKLRPITNEEQEILTGKNSINKTFYNKNNSSVFDASTLLTEGKLIDIRTHTRFIHFPKHSHNYIEMVYMVSGMTRHIVNGNEIILRQGELLIMNQHATQEIFPARENDIAVNFVILPEFFDTTLAMLGSKQSMLRDFLVDCLRSSTTDIDYLHYSVSDVLPVQNLMENLIYTIINDDSRSNQLIQTTVGLLFMNLIHQTDTLTLGGNRLEDDIIIKVLGQIEEHYKDVELQNLCDSLNVDLYTISRIIKRKTGRTYKDLLQEKRLDQAAFLLKTTTLPITDIAVNVGYNNFSYFYKIFNKKYGLTPKEFRELKKL